MKISYTGKLGPLGDEDQRKLERRYRKLGLLLDKREGEREAHVILRDEKNRFESEITVDFADHILVGQADGPEQFETLLSAIDKLEKQIFRLHDKRIDAKRKRSGKTGPEPADFAINPGVSEDFQSQAFPDIVRVDGAPDRKPMTLDEAVLEMEDNRDFVVYRDADSERLAILLRQRDGRLALIEA